MEHERPARRFTRWTTVAALVAWLLLAFRHHAWDRGLTAGHWELQVGLFRVALAFGALALLGELTLLRGSRASWVRFVVALLPLALLCQDGWRPSEGIAVSVGVVITAAFVIGFGSPSARVRVSALMLGGVVCFGMLEDLLFRWHGSDPLSGVVAERFARSYWTQRIPMTSALIGFATGLAGRNRWPAVAGLSVALGAVSLELLGTAAARQVDAAASSGGVFPLVWSVDELASAATLVECVLVGVLVFVALARLFHVVRRRSRFDSRGTVPALALAALVVFSAQSPVRAPVPSRGPVPLAEATPWGSWPYRWGDRFPMGTQALVMDGAGRTTSFYGRRPIDGLRFAPLARTEIHPDRSAPASALVHVIRRLLRQVPEVRIAVQRSDARHLPVPGAAARTRYVFAATMVPRTGFQRTIRPGAGPDRRELTEDRLPCPSVAGDEPVASWLARRSSSCVLEPDGPDVTVAAPLAPIGELPSWKGKEPRRPLPLLIGALLGLAAAILYGHTTIARDLAPLRGRREPAPGPRRRAPVHPIWLRRRDATHRWIQGATPYRDGRWFCGPRDRSTARRLLRRRGWEIAGRTIRSLLGWTVVATAIGLLGLLGSIWL